MSTILHFTKKLSYVENRTGEMKECKQAEIKNIERIRNEETPRLYVAEDCNLIIKYYYRKISRSAYEANPDNYPDYLEIIDRKKRVKVPVEYLGCVYGHGEGRGYHRAYHKTCIEKPFSSSLVIDTIHRNRIRIRKFETTTNSYQSRIKMIYL